MVAEDLLSKHSNTEEFDKAAKEVTTVRETMEIIYNTGVFQRRLEALTSYDGTASRPIWTPHIRPSRP